MSNKRKQSLIRKALITCFFTAEFGLAFGCIAAGSMFLYGTAAVAGVLIPAFIQHYSA